MKNKKFEIGLMISIGCLMSSCSLIEKAEEIIIPSENGDIETSLTQEKTIKIRCDRDSIKKYIDEGWEIKNQSEKEVPCTWKSKKSKKGCDLDKDKGCKITVPDTMGKEVEFLLEKVVNTNKEEYKRKNILDMIKFR